MECHQPQEVWAVALIIRMLDASEVVSFFRCALKVKLLSKITPRTGVDVNVLITNKDSWIPRD